MEKNLDETEDLVKESEVANYVVLSEIDHSTNVMQVLAVPVVVKTKTKVITPSSEMEIRD